MKVILVKILRWRWGEAIVEWPRLCGFIDRFLGGVTRGIAVWPFIFVRDQRHLADAGLLNHERIHLAQERDLAVVGMFALYYAELIWAKVVLKMPMREAYFWLSAEQEAYLNQHDTGYLKDRKWLDQLRYLKNKRRFRTTAKAGEIEFY